MPIKLFRFFSIELLICQSSNEHSYKWYSIYQTQTQRITLNNFQYLHCKVITKNISSFFLPFSILMGHPPNNILNNPLTIPNILPLCLAASRVSYWKANLAIFLLPCLYTRSQQLLYHFQPQYGVPAACNVVSLILRKPISNWVNILYDNNIQSAGFPLISGHLSVSTLLPTTHMTLFCLVLHFRKAGSRILTWQIATC